MLLSSRKLRIGLSRCIRSGNKILYRSFIGMSFLAIICCGKKVEDSDKSSGTQRYATPVASDLEKILSDQQVSCEPGNVCPNYIGLVSVIDKGRIHSCTGYLVERDVVVTSASCLPSMLRLANQDCSKDVHIFFGGAGASDKTDRFACQRIISSSELKTSNPTRWRDDVAFLKMSAPAPYRRTLKFSRKGFHHFENYLAWYVARMDEKTTFVKKAICRNIQSSYVNPFANHPSSPNILISDCDLPENSSGAPLLDARGEVRGMLSTKMSGVISDYLSKAGLLVAPLKTIFHGTSFACAPTIYDSQVLDEAECLKDMGQVSLDEAISKLLEPKKVFEEARQKIEAELNSKMPYMNVTTSLEGKNGDRYLTFSPRCFKPLGDWIDQVENTNALVTEFSFPAVRVKKALDSYGRLFAHVIRNQSEKYYLQFSVRNLKRYSNSRVYFWGDDFKFTYPRLTANCF